MMQIEFENEYGRSVTQEEYAEIEQAYYGFVGDKHAFIKIMISLRDDPSLMEDFLQTCYARDNGNQKPIRFNITCDAKDFYAKAHRGYAFAHAAKLETFRLEMITGFSWACLE